jgi:hypothetical protein
MTTVAPVCEKRALLGVRHAPLLYGVLMGLLPPPGTGLHEIFGGRFWLEKSRLVTNRLGIGKGRAGGPVRTDASLLLFCDVHPVVIIMPSPLV